MIRIVVALCVLAGAAYGAPDDDYQAASKLAGASATVPSAIDAFEKLGAERPVSRWTDNAWSEAGRLAERIGELSRARHAYEQVLAVTEDRSLRDRARGGLERLGGARWDQVKREHGKWLAESLSGNPQEALGQLERLAAEHPDYPERANIQLAIAHGRELEGESARAIEVLREAFAKAEVQDRSRLGFAFVRMATRRGFLDDARVALEQLTASGADRGVIAKLRARLDTAEHRAWWRRGMWLGVAVFAALAAWMLRRETGSWRAAGKQVLRPPGEVIFLLPIAGVLVAIAFTGNPVFARAVLGILAGGVIATWISGALFEARRGRIGAARAIVQAVLTIAAIGCVTYLAIDRDRLLDLVEETVEHGPTR